MVDRCIFLGPMPKQTHELLIYKCGFRFSVFLVLEKKDKIRVWMIVSKKSALGQKLATSKKKFSGKHNFGFGVAYSNKLQMKFNTAIY